VRQQKQQQSNLHEQRALIVDEFGELSRQVQLWQPTIRRRDELRRIIENWYALSPADQSAIAAGFAYQVVIGPRAEHRIINCQLLYEQLGDEFWENAVYPLKYFDALKINKSGLSTSERIGSRSVTPVLLNTAIAKNEATEPQPRRGRGRPRKAA